MITLLVLLIILNVSDVQSNSNYCSITREHTLCRYKGPGPRCRNSYVIGLSSNERRFIIDLHNELRSKVATGNERRGHRGQAQPSASNMQLMEWDNELALSAQRLAEQCKYRHDCLDCRKVSRFYTGQNIYQFSENFLTEGSDWSQAIMAWYDEVKDFNPNLIKKFKFIHDLGHYTQMLWAETNKIGCGYAFYKDGRWNRKLYVCNYGPAGNVITTEMYSVGQPCASCPGQCSNKFPGLCSGPPSQSSSSLQTPKPTTTSRLQTTTRRPTTTRAPAIIKTRPTPRTKYNTRVTPTRGKLTTTTRRVVPNRRQNTYNRVTTKTTTTPRTTSYKAKLKAKTVYKSKPKQISKSKGRYTTSNYNRGTINNYSKLNKNKPNLSTAITTTIKPFKPRKRTRVNESHIKNLRLKTSPAYKANLSAILIYCDFDYSLCPIKLTGGWNYTVRHYEEYGKGFGLALGEDDSGELNIRVNNRFHKNSRTLSLCLHFRYIWLGLGDELFNGFNVGIKDTNNLKVATMATFSDDIAHHSEWLNGRVQFQNIQNYDQFILFFNIFAHHVYFALDDILVTNGDCNSFVY